MAVVATPQSCSLQIAVQVGTDTLGRPLNRKRIFNSLKASLTDQQVYDLSVVLAGLQNFPAVGTQRVNPVDLANA